MQAIKQIAEYIREQLDDAEEYAEAAHQYRDTDTRLGDQYFELARQELNHVNLLHAQAVRLIKAQQDAGREVPAPMQAVWDWQHAHMVEHQNDIERMMEMYRK